MNRAMMQQMMQQMPTGPPEPLALIRAGKMEVKTSPTTPGKFSVTALLEKGQIQIIKDEQGITKFQWKNRISDAVDPTCDHMMFPGDATFSKCNTGRPDDRCVLLQFKDRPDRRFFFWLQDANSTPEKDTELISKMNDALQGTLPVPEGEEAGAMADDAAAAAAAAATPAAPAGVNMEDLMRVLGMPAAATGAAASASPAPVAPAPSASPGGAAAVPAATATPAVPAAAAATTPASAVAPTPSPAAAATQAPAAPAPARGGALTAEDLARAMAGISAMPGLVERVPPVPLQDAATVDEIMASGVLSNPEVQAQLLPLLPEGHQTPAELFATVQSPQLQQALGSLSNALQSENYNSVVANFGLNPAAGAEAMARGDNIEAFVNSVQAQADANPPPPSQSGQEGKESEGGSGAGASGNA